LLLQDALFTLTPIYLAVVQCMLTLVSVQWLWSVVSCKAVIDNNSNNKNAFPAHDELGTCRTSVVSLQQPVLCIPISPADTTFLTMT